MTSQTSLFSLTIGEDTEFKRRLSQTGFTAEMVRAMNTSPDNALLRHLYSATLLHLAPPPPAQASGRFTSFAQQYETVVAWKTLFGLEEITDRMLQLAGSCMPPWPTDPLSAVVLVPYLADKVENDGSTTSGAFRTYKFLWERAKGVQDRSWSWSDLQGACLRDEIVHEPGLRWEVINFGAKCNEIPDTISAAEVLMLPHAGIMAAAAHFPQWIRQMNGTTVPYVRLPAYHVQKREHEAGGACSPALLYDQKAKSIMLGSGANATSTHKSDQKWSTPRFVTRPVFI